MKSATTVFKIGFGPSSSHTYGPHVAMKKMVKEYIPELLKDEKRCDGLVGNLSMKVILRGSMALTGTGHFTDRILVDTAKELSDDTDIEYFCLTESDLDVRNFVEFDFETDGLGHPNTLIFRLFSPLDDCDWCEDVEIRSIGGGEIEFGPFQEKDGKACSCPTPTDIPLTYEEDSVSAIMATCEEEGTKLWQYVYNRERDWWPHRPEELTEYADIQDYFVAVWHAMKDCVEHGLEYDNSSSMFLKEPEYRDLRLTQRRSLDLCIPFLLYELPEIDHLRIRKKAPTMYTRALMALGNSPPDPFLHRHASLFAFALSVMETNATYLYPASPRAVPIVTAPTCGSAGVIPAVFYYLYRNMVLGAFAMEENPVQAADEHMAKGLAVASIFGNVVTTKYSVAGSVGGCMAEIGVASSLAAAGGCFLLNGRKHHIECAAESALEHCLGLTCRPMKGLVLVPCIERNANAAVSSLCTSEYSLLTDGEHRILFDEVVDEMRETGVKMCVKFKETRSFGAGETESVERVKEMVYLAGEMEEEYFKDDSFKEEGVLFEKRERKEVGEFVDLFHKKRRELLLDEKENNANIEDVDFGEELVNDRYFIIVKLVQEWFPIKDKESETTDDKQEEMDEDDDGDDWKGCTSC